MRCAVIAAVLLLVYIQDAAAGPPASATSVCKSKYAPVHCGGGWYRIDVRRCAKYFMEKRNFDQAERRCKSLRSNLVSMHNADQNNYVMCLSQRTTKSKAQFWIGGRVEGLVVTNIKWTDGTKDNFNSWATFQPDNVWEKCVEMNYGDWGLWNNEVCGHTRHFVCAKNM